MKMPENMTCWPPFPAERTRHRAILRLQWRTFACVYNGVRLKNSNRDATMCAIIAQFIRDLLDFAGLSSNLAYITSAFIGYIGTDSIGSLIKRFVAKKAGVEDGVEHNQRKAFLDMLAWSEGTDNDVRKSNCKVTPHRRRAIYRLLRSPRKLVTLNPKLNYQAPTLSASSPLVGCHRKQFGLKDFPKVRTLWHCSRLRSVALYL